MSLFDGAMQEGQRTTRKISNKIKALKPVKRKRPDYSESSETPKISRDERRRFTEAYERGEIKFEDISHKFLLCRCDRSYYPHEIHVEELATFELLSYARKK